MTLVLIRRMGKSKKGNRVVARELPIAELEELLLKNGRLIRSLREERTTLKKFVYEINIARTQMIKYEAGGDMRLSTFLKVLYGLDIGFDAFFKELEKRASN